MALRYRNNRSPCGADLAGSNHGKPPAWRIFQRELRKTGYDPRNLWPEPSVSADGWRADRKDELEKVLARLVCAGRMPLADAQRAMAADWTAAYGRYVTGRQDGTFKPRRPGLPAASAQTPSRTPPAGMTCPDDKLVWVNTRSGARHFQGDRYFGSTKRGRFICERDADEEGDRRTMPIPPVN
jgi:hypothetical protein